MAHLLIIDDDQNTLASLARAFRMAGHEATVCDNTARALELAAQSDRPSDAQGVMLTRIERTDRADGLTYKTLDVTIDRAKRMATFTAKAPQSGQPTSIDAIMAAGVHWWPLQVARELDDAILSMRTNELEVGTWVFKTEGDARHLLGVDATLMQHKDHWFVRETIGLLRRKGVEFTEIEAGFDPAKRQEMIDRSGRTTFPQIFVGDTHIGGCDELMDLDSAGRFDPMLHA